MKTIQPFGYSRQAQDDRKEAQEISEHKDADVKQDAEKDLQAPDERVGLL